MAVIRSDSTRPAIAPVWCAVQRWLSRRAGVARLGVVVLLLLVWEIAARYFLDRDFVSPPSTVFMSLGKLFGTPGVPS
ncbi:MAG: hypothetical protein WB868_12460, partial [Xanthobacteraceae bacterium]